ncbi:uncharacterized protein LOC26526105 [Drosophila erecta]|uniref:Seminal fluid protein n=1 Tax=Drosophila erecta TaxID=7220 RepID=A0A0Q5VXJ0_DROER|nr:uncharacterized protein LOC26526105 [Drosophila erecta]KQS62859.1 uncharacterized protein Dere_GG26281 [Drosophila erecta]
MKSSFLVCIILATVFILNVSGNSNSSSSEDELDSPVGVVLTRSKTTSRKSQTCRRSVQKNCSSSTKTCARLGRANICQAFKNDCDRQLSNCGAKKFYRKVSLVLCRGLPIDVLRPCGSGQSIAKGP